MSSIKPVRRFEHQLKSRKLALVGALWLIEALAVGYGGCSNADRQMELGLNGLS
jgi:hypothetical protein